MLLRNGEQLSGQFGISVPHALPQQVNAPVVVKVEVPDPAEPVVGIQLLKRLPLLRPGGLALLQLARMERTHHRRKEVEPLSVKIGGGLAPRGGRLPEKRLRLVFLFRRTGHGVRKLRGRDVPGDVLDLREHAQRTPRRIARQSGEALRPNEDVLDLLVLRLDRLRR